MSLLKRFVFLALFGLIAAKLSYAAIVDINSTAFSSGSDLKATGSPSGDGGHTSTSEGVTCGAVTAATENGCNAALGIASGAVATACDGGLFTCTLPATRGPNPDCDAGAKNTAAECTAQGATGIACGADGTKFNCECPANYTQTCNNAAGKYADPSQSCVNTRNEVYIPDTSTCLDTCITPADGVRFADSASGFAPTCKGNQSKCYSAGDAKFVYQCDQRCRTMATKFPEYQQTTTCSSLNGIDAGMTCGDGSVKLCQCDSSKYMADFEKEPLCGGTNRPIIDNACVAENPLNADNTCKNGISGEGFCIAGNKYSKECGVPTCTAAEMTTMNWANCSGSTWAAIPPKTWAPTLIDGKSTYNLNIRCAGSVSYTKPTLQGGTKELYSCTLPAGKEAKCGSHATVISQVVVCGCDSSYDIVGNDTTWTASELTAKGLTKCEAGERPVSHPLTFPSSGFCIWDAQTASTQIAGDTTGKNGQIATLVAGNIRYDTECLKECLQWEKDLPGAVEGDSGYGSFSCSDGKEEAKCSIAATPTPVAGQSVQLYRTKKYCTCPKADDGSNLYTDSCPSGLLLGGKSCTETTGGNLIYQYCLKPCDGNGDRKFTTSAASEATCGFSQNLGGNTDDRDFIESANSPACFDPSKTKPEDRAVMFQCRCPITFKTDAQCATDEADTVGTGESCKLDVDTPKYGSCLPKCPDSGNNPVRDSETGCDITGIDGVRAIACSFPDRKLMYQCLCPLNYQSKLEKCGGSLTGTITNCPAPACTECMAATVGTGIACDYESRVDGVQKEELKKYLDWGQSCAYLKDQGREIGNIGACTFPTDEICFDDGGEKKNVCKCPSTYKTMEDYCAAPGQDADCLSSHIGIGKVCEYDFDGAGGKLTKYEKFEKRCPADTIRPVFSSKASCAVGDLPGGSEECYVSATDINPKYICTCPNTFDKTCANPLQIRGGAACGLETKNTAEYKYEKCLPQCQNSSTTPVVGAPENCPMVDGFQANADEQCFNKFGDEKPNYACRCPKSQNYKTLAEFCENGTVFDGITYSKAECLARVTGVGIACTFDGIGINKYRAFSVVCPTDRPLFNSVHDCATASIPGEVDYTCYERNNPTTQRIVCKCPANWVDLSGSSGGANVCGANLEASGQVCNFDGDNKLKYAKCYTRCDKLASNGKGVTYLKEEDNSKLECTNQLGDGATLGVDGEGEACSRNNTLLYPCYCNSRYTEQCLNSDNEIPAADALACTVGGITYYDTCANNDCGDEGAATAIIADNDAGKSADLLCQASFGNGATGKRCGENQVECSCNARVYTETCEYPYQTPDLSSVRYCKYSTDGGLMKNGKNHFELGQCKIQEVLAVCGEHILEPDGTPNSSYTIKVAASEAACKSQYGTGVSTQLCADKNNPNKRSYNCYYDAALFQWTEDNCPVRHVLSTKYIISGGKKHYQTCDCHSAYKFHRYNCAGMLSGGVCEQTVDAAKKASDPTLSPVPVGGTLAFYPYCQCTSDYNQVCDGDRNVGVGELCNGKYTACECKPDSLPENWADNYYGCPGGNKPTGITKPNGCGGKYYQCSVTQCTWQHTEKCAPPLIGVDGCQDNQGNIGGYKSCKCPTGYIICPTGTVGEGEPCLLKGQYYYKESNCVTEGKCVHGETQTCTAPLQIGVNPCKRNGITYFEYCVCASGYNKKCDGDNEVGVGTYCALNGTNFYAECANPSMTCTAEHKTACDINQTSYDPCVNSENKIMYKCKCPSNYSKCTDTGPAVGADVCSDVNGTVYSACAVVGECTPSQNNAYKVCNEFQIGSGGSCVYTDADGNSTTKYAKCEETSECRANGFQYTCSGYDTTVLGDACVDENGNKLYKECKCPENWAECTGKNNTKGESCVPLKPNGTSGNTVYSSCTCDASIYKYTCEIDTDGGNKGIVPGVSKACTYLSEGKEITKYESCGCNAAYKYTCTGNGQSGDENDFCQSTPGAVKLYKKCVCDPKFKETCVYDQNNPGMTAPKDKNLACTPQNPDDGDISTKYTKCECGAQYTFTCESDGQVGDESAFCIADGAKRYRTCNCKPEYQYDCQTNPGGSGTIKPGSNEQCAKQYHRDDIPQTPIFYYKTCDCKPGYTLSCDSTEDPDKFSPLENYVIDSSNYCGEITSGSSEDGGVTDTIVKSYNKCMCKDGYEEECPDGLVPLPVEELDSTQFCKEYASANTTTPKIKYAESACFCDATPEGALIGWTKAEGITIEGTEEKVNYNQLSASAKTALEQIFRKECGHKDNGQLRTNNCGQVYHKCIVPLADYPYSLATCPSPKSLSGTPKQVTNAWNGAPNFDMYPKCSCDRTRYKRQDCNTWTIQGLAPGGSVGCFRYKKGDGDAWGIIACGTNAVILSGNSCTDDDGTYYEKCVCNRASFPYGQDCYNNAHNCWDDEHPSDCWGGCDRPGQQRSPYCRWGD